MSDKEKLPVERAQCEIWLLVNSDGGYVVSHDEDQVSDLYNDEIGGVPANCRTIHISLSVPLPRGIEVSAEVPEDEETLTLQLR